MKEISRYYYQHAEKPDETLDMFRGMVDVFGLDLTSNWFLSMMSAS